MWGKWPAIKAQLFYDESKDTLQLKHKTLTMEAKNIFHCGKKKEGVTLILWYWEIMNPPHLRSPSELSYLGSRSLASSCQPERYGQTHPSQLSQLSIKRNVEKVFSWANPGQITKKFWNAENSIFDAAYIYYEYSLSTSGNEVKDLLCAIICMHSFCPSLKYFPNVKIFLTGVEIWTNKSQ